MKATKDQELLTATTDAVKLEEEVRRAKEETEQLQQVHDLCAKTHYLSFLLLTYTQHEFWNFFQTKQSRTHTCAADI